MTEAAPEPAQVRAALEELLGWPGISRSPQISELLRYVVEKTLAGESAAIKAYAIAVDVLGRPANFDPQADPIVRVQARRLRQLLDEFYASGTSRSGVEIRLPVGRYVPEFRFVAEPEPTPARGSADGSGQTPRRGMSRFGTSVVLGFAFTVIGVALTVALLRWLSPVPAPAPAIPPAPVVFVAPFDNLTGDPVLDDDVARVSVKLAESLAKFDTLTIGPRGANLTIGGTVEEDDNRFSIKVLLTQGNGILWSTTTSVPPGFTDTVALEHGVSEIAAQLGNASGPLHAAGRSWVKLQTGPVAQPTLYYCQLLYMSWRDTRLLADADAAMACLDTVLVVQPESPAALAAWAGVDAWRESFLAGVGTDLVTKLSEPTTRVAKAVLLAPQDSFVHEQQALVLGRQGSIDAALGAVDKAMSLNPANLDAKAVAGIVTWLAGDFDAGSDLGEDAIAGLATPPPWYYMTRAFEALREKRYFDAVGAGLALTAGDEEFGPVIVLAAAQRAGRTDLVDRFRPIIMSNPRFQDSGILPRLALLIRPQQLIDRIRDGLTIAGIPPNALNAPFVGDGSPRQPARP